MSISDGDEYGDIPDEDLIELHSQASQQLPSLSRAKKRRRISPSSDSDESIDDGRPSRSRRRSRNSAESGQDGEPGGEDQRKKKPRYKIHINEQGCEIPAAIVVGATQAEAMPDSSPFRIRGPIIKMARPGPPKSPSPKPLPFTATPRRPDERSMQPRSLQRATSGMSMEDCSKELEDLPSDAFLSSPEFEELSVRPTVFSSPTRTRVGPATQTARQHLAAPQNGLRQTTLFGGRASQAQVSASQARKVHNFRVDHPPEEPTHHALDHEQLKTWVYPTNLGEIRDYQYSIVKNGLFNNLLVALPTGLGKTFIAATIMFNFFRWTRDAKIVFVAPTKPLVAQQVEACFQTVAIPRSTTAMLTGEVGRALRAEEWADKRVFFMTPQTLENDLKYGYADPKKIVLLVVDEAHRATGNYAYNNIVKIMRQFNKSFRVLALTATPGASVEAVQEVIDGLEISKVEIRTENSIDIQQYVHDRDIEQIILDPSDEMVMIKELYSKALQPLVNKLCGLNAYYNRDPMALTTFGVIQARKNWLKSPAARNANAGVKGMAFGLFTILSSLAHGIKMLNFHGIGPFYSAVNELRQEVQSKGAGSKYKKQVVDSPDFKKMMDHIQHWVSRDDFVGHPKMTYLCDTILNHFMDAGEGRLGADAPPSSTRVIVFAEFRDSAEEIVRVLNRHGPMVRASVFVGQADSKRSAGMNQDAQQAAIGKFKLGTFNVIVATSIGEEGLDIGQVDLIVCYDASSSPIRMLQRMGRTGRKRAGKIVLLLMRGKEEESFAKAKDNYEQMQKMISSGARFNFRHDLSRRIVPKDITPVVEKRIIDIPLENTQDTSLPEPRRRGRKATTKAPAKKFHMPDGVETGFRTASKWGADGTLTDFGVTRKVKEVAKTQLAPIPPLESVLLDASAEVDFQRNYLFVAGSDIQEVGIPDVTAQTLSQRSLSRTVKVPHGAHTKRCVLLFKALAEANGTIHRFSHNQSSDLSWLKAPALVDEVGESAVSERSRKVATAKRTAVRPRKKAVPVLADLEDDDDDDDDSEDSMPGNHSNRNTQGYNHIEDEGESVGATDTAGEESSDDDVGSLKDFLASERSENLPSSRLIPTQTTASSPVIHNATRPFFEPTQFTATQETNDDDMPDLNDLFSSSRKTSHRPTSIEVMSSSSGDEAPPKPKTLSKKQSKPVNNPFQDSDDEETGDDTFAARIGPKKRPSKSLSNDRIQDSDDNESDETEEEEVVVRAPGGRRKQLRVVDSDSDE
ncbi:p-loop containing nucleoside triphosphate hydrolase-19 [Coleophoma cylindrospora]|uniref:ATP-dependent DNA helicase n=1 Tax=Coleophoma cylindrospora TaxID=1849047 RepID=A0A3D8RT05_9HELO|nr:p-loop containing nucleoside triphosphate hydrolase-19 [Coleophoma cylindrospora]